MKLAVMDFEMEEVFSTEWWGLLGTIGEICLWL